MYVIQHLVIINAFKILKYVFYSRIGLHSRHGSYVVIVQQIKFSFFGLTTSVQDQRCDQNLPSSLTRNERGRVPVDRC